VALQVTVHNNGGQVSSLIVPTEPPPVDDPSRATATASQVNLTSNTNIPQEGILRNHDYPKMSYPSSSKTKWQKSEKVAKKPDYIDTFFSEMGYTPKKASSRLPHLSTLSTSVSLVHQAMLDQTATVDNNCLYCEHAMKANDCNDFCKAMSVELKAHINRGHWVKMPCRDLPKDVKPIKMVWSFKCKCRPGGSLLKHKARLCVHGGMQKKGVNFWETYSPICAMVYHMTPADTKQAGHTLFQHL
jgi:hypothetical protein